MQVEFIQGAYSIFLIKILQYLTVSIAYFIYSDISSISSSKDEQTRALGASFIIII